jgi:hypothetical protein
MGPQSPIAPKVPVNKFRLKDLFSNDVKFQKPTDEIIIFFSHTSCRNKNNCCLA